MDPDVRLMLQVRADEPGAFEELIERYQNRVLGILFHVVGDRQDAEDLAQEVFMRIYRARRGYKPTAKFSTWLFTIANNLASNALRSKRRRQAVSLDGRDSGPLGARPQEQLVADPNQAASGQFVKNEVAQIVRDAVNKLNERQRVAVVLNKFEDMSYAEIGQIMGLTEKAVKSLLSRARTNLREMLEPYLEV
jgi:RNA polymerase sigma-70 factor (ECF subfamily)